MNLVSVEGISKAYGEKVLFEPISFGINKDQKIALIAKNGSGKTSILKILAGTDTPDQGAVNYRKDTRISFLPQEPKLDPKLTVEQAILQSGSKILNIIANYDRALENPDDHEAYQKAFEAMDQNDAWDFENQYKQILSKLKLDRLDAKVGALSGGQKKRIALCNVLLEQPELLILDEPTNHLDLEMIEWLEDYFKKEKITLLMVTHDRYFLERVCNEIIELDEGKLYSYKGNYSCARTSGGP
jgi:ATP-binding cassette subfamily F protein uup